MRIATSHGTAAACAAPQRQRFKADGGGQSGSTAGSGCMALSQYRSDAADDAVLVNIAHRHVRKARVGAQGGRQPCREQRMAAQVGEKVRAAADRLAGKQFGQCREQRFFSRLFSAVPNPPHSALSAASGRALRVLRSILPEVRRGISASGTNCPGHHIRRQAGAERGRSAAAEIVPDRFQGR